MSANRGERIGDSEGDESLPKSLILRLLTGAFLFFFFFFFFLANLGSSIRMYPYVRRMYSYVTRMYLYVLVCFSYVTRMLPVCTRMLLRMYSYELVCIRMSLVYHPCGVLVTIHFFQNYCLLLIKTGCSQFIEMHFYKKIFNY